MIGQREGSLRMRGDGRELTEAQWETLRAGPSHMFVLVATADSHADRGEWAAFVQAVKAYAEHSDELLRRVMADLPTELADTAAARGDQEKALAGLREIRSTLEALDDGGTPFRSALLELGIVVAEASGAHVTRTFAGGEGTGWVRSAGTSATENAALQVAAEALGLASPRT